MRRDSDNGPSPDDPEAQLRERIIERVVERSGPNKDSILNALIVAAILALVGAVYTLRDAVTVLQVNQQRDEKVLDTLAKAHP